MDAMRERIAARLTRARERSDLLTALEDADLTSQVSPLMSPLVWDLAHVGNYEELWLLRAAVGAAPLRPEIDGLYDAFEHPRSTRPTLPLLPPEEARQYIRTVRSMVLDSLDGLREDRLFLYDMVIQHEHQHDETMLATHQLRKEPSGLPEPEADVTEVTPFEPERFVPGGPFTMGTDDPEVYDNERPAHVVDVAPFFIDTVPVSNAAYMAFIEDGGYENERWWHPQGWAWKQAKQAKAPAFWFREGVWLRRRFGTVEQVPPDQAVQHVCWYEADAYARWAGRRLPTEAEWEKAARWDETAQRSLRYPWGDSYLPGRANLGQRRLQPAKAGAYADGASPSGVRQLVGDVWEWTSTDFHGYPGFQVKPYKEYSEVFFGPEYKVLRGGSWATDPVAARGTFRNWDYPIRRQIFAGFRCARSL
ncbi:ergothioneine biosynthesis protein EgtB [Actinocorallia sp. API 0066]|uniref:ergothioneine biosynthesis protein EgtB n=1 Tax=Actinocorallia sp. API 0066 TaxID=2896846 RepID=UPI001E598F3C|nr:ergothioneine biosynthesis protein EgtB [Actinocorallia sp. API 0066]MCD0448237.1 ergothioneine biosynthesis protein EgtB [Actinocorallia sp. API 0066]